jgi:hypothetical protein
MDQIPIGFWVFLLVQHGGENARQGENRHPALASFADFAAAARDKLNATPVLRIVQVNKVL